MPSRSMSSSFAAFFRRGRQLSSESPEGSNFLSGDSDKILEQVRKLVSEDRLVESKRILTDSLAKNGNDIAFLRRLAEVEGRQGNHETAASHLLTAWKIDSSVVDTAAEYASSLYMSSRDGEALSFIQNLPGELRDNPSIREVLGSIYDGIGWPAHAVIAYGGLRSLQWRFRFRSVANWWRCGAPLPVHGSRQWALESKVNDLWKAKSADRRAMLDTIDLSSESERIQVNAQLDTSLLWLLTAQLQLEAREDKELGRPRRLTYLAVASLVAAVIISIFRNPKVGAPSVVFGSLILGALTGSAVIYSADIIKAAIKRGMRLTFGLVTWFMFAYAGLSLTLLSGITTPAGIAGILIADIGITSAVCLDSYYERLRTVTRRRQNYLQWFILGTFLDVLIEVDDPDNTRNDRERAHWVTAMEEAAFTIEHFLMCRLNCRDSTIREWISLRAYEAASTVRLMACCIAVPREGTWERLRSDLRRCVTAIAAGDFGAFPEPEATFPRRRLSRRRRVVMNLVRTAVAFILLATLIGVLVAFKRQTTIQLAGTAVITALIPVVIGVLLGAAREGSDEGDISLGNE